MDSGTATGDIDYIALRNNIVPFIGGGEISASSSLSVGGGLNLDMYCVSPLTQYKPNGKFSGTQIVNCTVSVFPCSRGTTAGEVSVAGRITTAGGRGVGGARVTVSGGELTQPIAALTSPFGYYSFTGLKAGQVYFISVKSKRHRFTNSSRALSVSDNLTDVDFVADNSNP